MTGSNIREDFNIEAIFNEYFQNKFYEALPKGFKHYDTKCCETKLIINDNSVAVCVFCGQVSHYEMVIEGFNNFYENLYRIRRKSKYKRKYHIRNVLIDKLLQNHIYLTVEAENKLIRIFNQVVTIFFRLYPSRKRLLKFNFIFYKIFSEVKFEGFSQSEYKIFLARLTKQTEKKYNQIWNNISAYL